MSVLMYPKPNWQRLVPLATCVFTPGLNDQANDDRHTGSARGGGAPPGARHYHGAVAQALGEEEAVVGHVAGMACAQGQRH
jgi:hypothetical protein